MPSSVFFAKLATMKVHQQIKLILGFIFLFQVTHSKAQPDFNPTVKVVDAQITLSDKSVFRRIENDIKQFFINTKWSSDKISPNEVIEFYIEIQLKSYNSQSGEITATAIVQSRRPVFGSNYNTVLLSFNDENFDFTYTEQTRLDFNENSYSSNLTSMLAFYANFILGLDYDSFGLEGGTYYFNKANNITTLAQQSNYSGWKPFERLSKTRYTLIDNILNDRFKPLRNAMYIYHRKGLDNFYKDPESSRKQIYNALLLVKKVYSISPNSPMLLVFFEAKSDELVGIYKNANEIEKPKVMELLTEINVANASKYDKIRPN